MLVRLPRNSDRLFTRTLPRNFFLQRKVIAEHLGNPRLLEVGLHTFSHWAGTVAYHRTEDIIYVQQFLRHRSIKNTLVYITVERALFEGSCGDEFTVKVARTLEEACKLVEVGFGYVTNMGETKIFRKRK